MRACVVWATSNTRCSPELAARPDGIERNIVSAPTAVRCLPGHSRRCQRSEQGAAADAEHGGQFAYRLALLVQAQQSFLLGPVKLHGLGSGQTPCDPGLTGCPLTSPSWAAASAWRRAPIANRVTVVRP